MSEELYARRDSVPQNRHAELVVVKDLEQFKSQLGQNERAVVLAPLSHLLKLKQEFPKILSSQLLPRDITQEKLLFSVRLALQEARLQHDLDAAESVAWSGSGSFDDPSIELLGASILELSAARDMESVQEVLLNAAQRLATVHEVRVVAYPETASSLSLGLYQLAVPVQFQGALKAHVYVRFEGQPDQAVLEKISEMLLNLSDGVALAVERNLMISKAEETKTVWEASFDAVEDPVAILDEEFRLLRGNRAFGELLRVPLVKLSGREPGVISIAELKNKAEASSNEWSMEISGRHYLVFLDPIAIPLAAGRYVLRLHDVTEERNLTEKILAKEQVAELGILVGSVAHEINNPIGGILAIGQILQKDLDKKTALYSEVSDIVFSAERCKKIVQTMLSLVKKAEEARREINVPECLESALDLLQSEAKRLQVRIKTVFENRNILMLANSNRLLQVFFHLLQQSLLAVSDRRNKQPGFEANILVSCKQGFENIEVSIEDNGDGVKHEYEIQSSVAFTVSKMILDEHEAQYMFVRRDNRNLQRIIFQQQASGSVSGTDAE